MGSNHVDITNEGACDEMEVETEVNREHNEADPVGETKKAEEIEGSDSVTFYPPAYLQRYCKVRETLKDLLGSEKYKNMYSSTGKTLMEVGCAEFGMMMHFKHLLDITKIIFVDLDEQLLEEKSHFLRPFAAEYLQRTTRVQPLVVEAYAGCVTKVDLDLRRKNPNVWAVIGIEIIEHLHADVLRGFEETVFGIVSPSIVIVTTPNSDFNEVFNLPPGKFRHWDHKFEWSRNEFQNWCEKIIDEFKNYTYKLEGICEGPEETRHLGHVSQMAIFEKQEENPETETSQSTVNSKFFWRIQSNSYKLKSSIQYPNYVETRTPETIVLHEFEYFLNTFVMNTSKLNEYDDMNIEDVKVPFTRLHTINDIEKASKGDNAFIRNVLETAGYKVVIDNDDMQVLINLKEYVAANMEDDETDDENRSEIELCEDLNDMCVEKKPDIFPEEEEWD